MAALTESQIKIVYTEGLADKVALVAIKNVDNLDTVDVQSIMSIPKKASFISTTGNLAGLCTISGTVITFAVTGMADDAGYLLLWGVSS